MAGNWGSPQLREKARTSTSSSHFDERFVRGRGRILDLLNLCRILAAGRVELS